MHDTEKQAEFIELRSQGKSYNEITKAIHIAKATCTEWNQKFEAEIAQRRQEHLEEIYSLYGTHKEARIQRIGDTLHRIDAAIEQKDLSELPADKLLELKLKYEAAMQAECSEPVTPITEHSLEGIYKQYELILAKTQSGEMTPAQSKAQLAIVQQAEITLRSIENRDRFQIGNGSGF